MKSFFKKLSFVLAAAMVVTMVPANTAKAATEKTTYLIDQNTAYTVAQPEEKVVLTVGDTSKDFKFVGIADYKTTGKGWTSSDESVVKVNKVNGKVEAVAEGTATITYKAAGYPDATAEVVVVPATAKKVDIKNQDNTDVKATLTIDEKVDYKFVGCDEWATSKKHTAFFDSSNDNVLVCTDATAGKFEAIAEGTATVCVAVVCDGKVCHAASIEVTVKKAAAMTVVQTTVDTAVLTFASKDAATAAAANLKVERFNPDKETKTEMRFIPTVSENTVAVKLYTNYAKNTDYIFTTADASTTLSVGDLKVVDLTMKAVNPETNSTVFEPRTNAKLIVNAWAKDDDGNMIDLGVVEIGRDDITLRTEDFAKGTLSGHDLYINAANDPFTVTAEYAGVTKTASFVAVDSSFALVGITKQSLRDIAAKFTDGVISIPQGDESQLYLEVATNGTPLATAKSSAIATNHEVIEQTKIYGGDTYVFSYEAKNPNILMVHPVDGTVKANNVGETEVIVYVTKTTNGVPVTTKFGAIKVVVTEERKLTTVTSVSTADQYQGVLNRGNFTDVTYTFICKDQYGDPVEGVAISEPNYADSSDTSYKTFVQRNVVETAKYPAFVDAADTSDADGYITLTLNAKDVTNYDRYTTQIEFKKTTAATATTIKKTQYTYLRVVNAPAVDDDFATVTAATEGKLVVLQDWAGNAVNAYYDAAKTYDIHQIVSANGSYTRYMLSNGNTNTANEKLGVVTYIKNGNVEYPYQVVNYVVSNKDEYIVLGKQAGADNVAAVAAQMTSVDGGKSIGLLQTFANGSTFLDREIATLNASALSRAYNSLFYVTILDPANNTYKTVDTNYLDFDTTNHSVVASEAALIATRTEGNYDTPQRNNVMGVRSQDPTDKTKTVVDLIKYNDSLVDVGVPAYATKTYTVQINAPKITGQIKNSENVGAKIAFTQVMSTFALTINNNTQAPTIVTKSNTTAANTSDYEVLKACIDTFKAPIGRGGAWVTKSFSKVDSATMKYTAASGEIGDVEFEIVKSEFNKGSDGYTIVGEYVAQIRVTVYLDGGTTYSTVLPVNQYVKY